MAVAASMLGYDMIRSARPDPLLFHRTITVPSSEHQLEINRIAMAMNECLKAHGFETEGTAETLLMAAQEWVEAGCPLTKKDCLCLLFFKKLSCPMAGARQVAKVAQAAIVLKD